MYKRIFACAWLVGLGLSIGCSDEDEPSLAEEIFSESCADFCERHDECLGPTDVGACIDECEDFEDRSEAAEDLIEVCDDCIDDGTCSEIEHCWQTCPVFPSMQ
jgi:hypothetical protein